MTGPTVWRAYSPSRDQVLFTGTGRSYVNGMAAYLNTATHHPDGGASDWEFQQGTITWETVDWPTEGDTE